MTVEICNAVNAPKSLDLKFFLEVLENGLVDAYVTIKKISFESGSGGGENYCSEIYRVRLTFQRGDGPLESTSVIVKSIPVAGAMRFLEELRVFLKEKIFYNKMLPRMEILLDKVKFGAKLYHSQKEPINTLVFEDLSTLGYVMADREQGLDFNHSQLIMKKLGQFHGVSMVLQRKEPTSMNAFNCGLLAEHVVNDVESHEIFFTNNIKGLIATISKWKGYESITRKVEKYAAHLKRNLVEAQQPIPGELKVLNHGDLWVNNFLFKYNKENCQQVEDVLYVDFQLSIYGSPGYDINYFLYSSLRLEVLKEKRTELLQIYYKSLCETLKLQGYENIPSFDDILTEVRRREPYGFVTTFGLLPIIAMDKTQSADNSMEGLLDDNIAKKKVEIMYSSKRVEDTLRYTLPRFDEMGILD